jgi:HAD superfamily hydrolase (TIGR01509 family)
MSEVELKAVLFDFDGTLVDSEPVYTAVFNKWMWERGISFEQQEQVNTLIQPGITWHDCLYIMSTVTQQPVDYAKDQAELEQAIQSYVMEVGAPLKDGVLRALGLLAERYKLAIVSSSPRNVIDCILQHHRMADYFSLITAGNDVQYPKPHPEPYVKTLKALKLKPEQAVALEDSLPGGQSAAAAGIFTYVWPDPHLRAEQFASFAKVVYSFDELLKDIL